MTIDVEQMAADYPYGICSTHLKKALAWLSENSIETDYTEFKGPDYFGMPKELYKKLAHMDIDYIQLYGNDYLRADECNMSL